MKPEIIVLSGNMIKDTKYQYYVKKSFFVKNDVTKEEVEGNIWKYIKQYEIGTYLHNPEGPALVYYNEKTGKSWKEGRLHGIRTYHIDEDGNKTVTELDNEQKELMNERENPKIKKTCSKCGKEIK